MLFRLNYGYASQLDVRTFCFRIRIICIVKYALFFPGSTRLFRNDLRSFPIHFRQLEKANTFEQWLCIVSAKANVNCIPIPIPFIVCGQSYFVRVRTHVRTKCNSIEMVGPIVDFFTLLFGFIFLHSKIPTEIISITKKKSIDSGNWDEKREKREIVKDQEMENNGTIDDSEKL